MKEKFCPKCGKETEELYDGLCKKCFLEERGIAGVPDRIELKVCDLCGRVMSEGKWKDEPLDKVIERKVRESADFHGSLSEYSIEVKFPFEDYSKVTVNIEGILGADKITETKNIDVEIEETKCGICSRRSSGYFEATLQIRGSSENVDETLKIVEKNLRGAKNRKGFVSDFKEVKNGTDILLGSKSVAKKLVKSISSEFETERKESKELAGEKEGERIYRSTYLVRILD